MPVDGWVSIGDSYVVEFVYFSFFVAVLVVTAYSYFNVTQRQAVLNFVLAYASMVFSVMIRTKRVETTEARRLHVRV